MKGTPLKMRLSLLQAQYIGWMDQYSQEEFESPIEVSDLEHIGVMYSTFEQYDEETDTYGKEHDLQVDADILHANDPKLRVYVDNKEVYVEALGPEAFLDDIASWTFDALYSWAVEMAEANWKEG